MERSSQNPSIVDLLLLFEAADVPGAVGGLEEYFHLTMPEPADGKIACLRRGLRGYKKTIILIIHRPHKIHHQSPLHQHRPPSRKAYER